MVVEAEVHAQGADVRGETTATAAALSLAKPRSRCPSCGHQITALENIPIVSCLVLRGKCSKCAAPISVRYPVIEALTVKPASVGLVH